MHKVTQSVKQTNGKLHADHLQTEELIADSRSILTPSQRVDEKLAACIGLFRRTEAHSNHGHAPRRPR